MVSVAASGIIIQPFTEFALASSKAPRDNVRVNARVVHETQSRKYTRSTRLLLSSLGRVKESPRLVIPIRFEVFWPKRAKKTRNGLG